MKRLMEILVLLAAAAGTARAQQIGPIHPASPPAIKRIPLHVEVAPPKLPPKVIIQRFAANEEKYKEAYQTFGYVQTILVQEMGEQSGGPTGSFGVKAEVYLKSNGQRYERLLGQTTSTLSDLQLSAQDLEVLADLPMFPLAGKSADQYTFTYRGTDRVDKLMTYVFRVKPKHPVVGQPYFSGVIWVDNQDLSIVKSYGEFVTGRRRTKGALPFHFFDTYRENIQGKYWFPTYIRSDDIVHAGENQLPVRLIIRSTDFHPGKPVLPAKKSSHSELREN